ncbi:hypothetical protein DUNSADRAFT_16566 [Dunaliella salina]|uniref:ZNF380 coiled-coil domain-containing protein n=1 Tax=Dunaliella salina TaxID=3046 RepID=A0ABQ7H0U9_DUNSA|nr:hypothetical protein DUNSADRAFT_16566 [Dunaliella salina]|eukprot:KAF5840475.1 hypothetical protein DUNSADRAFT_16566 [Dunaliella salina]
MSDLKAQFRAAKEQRGGNTPSLAQVKALKGQRAAQAQQQKQKPPGAPTAGSSAPKPLQQQPPPQPAPAPSTKGGLPEDFFEQPAKKQAVAASAPSSKPAPAPAALSSKSPADPSLPEGFFADKAADAKARGVKLPDAKDKEDEFQAFQRMMEEELKAVAAKEAEEVEEEAGDKEDREMFEQRLRMQRLRRLVQPKGKLGQGSDAQHQPQGEGTHAGIDDAAEEALGLSRHEHQRLGGEQPLLLPRKKRVIDTMRELGSSLKPEGDAGGSSDDEDSVSEEELLDWRAKGV